MAKIRGSGNSELGGATLGTPLPEASGGTGFSTFLAALKNALGAGGSAPVYGCRAWCVFSGIAVGTNPPIAGGNVTSITRTSAGDYTINFTVPMPSTGFAGVASAISNASTSSNVTSAFRTSVSTARVVHYEAGALADGGEICVAFFG